MNHANWFWLSRSPAVLYTEGWNAAGGLADCGSEAVHVCNPGATLTPLHLMRLADNLVRANPGWRHVVICGDREVAELAAASDSRVLYCHEHAFLPQHVWKPFDEPVEQYYRAILVANTQPRKRHGLCAEIEKLLVVTHRICDEGSLYESSIKPMLPKAHFAFAPGLGWADVDDMLGYYSQSRVGVMTSHNDNGCRAFGEYQLCGLPVVSTGCLGGRTDTADPKYFRLVPSTPSFVAAAVAELADLQFSRRQVRSAFISRVQDHRDRLEKHLGLSLAWDRVPARHNWSSLDSVGVGT